MEVLLLSLFISSEAVQMFPGVLARSPAAVETAIFTRARSEVIGIYMLKIINVTNFTLFYFHCL